MKNILLIIIFTISISSAYSQSNKIKTVDINTKIYCDHCSQCESCSQNIILKVKSNTKGVRSVKVNADANIISVKYNSKKTNLNEIEDAILSSGFKANEREPSEDAYNNLDGCCKN